MKLTIGFSTRDDADGAFFTINSLLAHHRADLETAGGYEIVVVDNSPEDSPHRADLQIDLRNLPQVRHLLMPGPPSSSLYKQRLFEAAQGDIVLCCDSHVIFEPGAIAALRDYFVQAPDSLDLVTGPCLARHGSVQGTNQMIYADEPYPIPHNAEVHEGTVWRGGAMGVWVHDPRGLDPAGAPFEIMQQGTGAFAVRRAAWPGFHPGFAGHGGNETYLMERIRERGGRVICLPALRWIHRFRHGHRKAPYPLVWEDRVRNYLLAATDLDRPDLYAGAVAHLRTKCPKTTEQFRQKIRQPTGLYQTLQKRLGTTPDEAPGQIPLALFNELRRRIRPGALTLEFGSGLSTLLFNELQAEHTAIENEPRWAARLQSQSLRETTRLIESPLDSRSEWYTWRPETTEQYDLILIDGPHGQSGNRAGCLHFLATLAAPAATILVDDTHRPLEAALSEDLAGMYGFRRQHIPLRGRAFDLLTRVADPEIYTAGPGSELEQLLKSRFKIATSRNCGCRGRIREMNYRGTEWCAANVDRIVDWLLSGAQAWQSEAAGLRRKWIELVPDFAKRAFLKSLVQDAIKQSVRDHPE